MVVYKLKQFSIGIYNFVHNGKANVNNTIDTTTMHKAAFKIVARGDTFIIDFIV
jgi:hypothetical protein